MINGKVLRASATDCDINLKHGLDGDTGFFNCLQLWRRLYLKVSLKPMRPYLHAQKKEIAHLNEIQEKEEWKQKNEDALKKMGASINSTG